MSFEGAIRNILDSLQKSKSTAKIASKLTKYPQQIYQALTQPSLFEESTVEKEVRDRILKVIKETNLRSYDRELKAIWNQYTQDQKIDEFIQMIDELFIENDYYSHLEPEEDTKEAMLKSIQRQDIQLICYEWIRPQSG